MVFKATRKTGRKLKTRVSFLLLVCLAMPVASDDKDLDLTSVPIAALTIRHCGHFLLTKTSEENEINISSKSRVPTKESMMSKKNSDMKILKRVRAQLKIARNHFRSNRDTIAWLYSDVKTVMQTNYHYEWLPSQPLVWYKKYVKKLDKDTRLSILLPVLRDSLHNFTVTLDQMRQFSETYYMSNNTIRKQILDDLSKHLIAVLCEVETAMVSLSELTDPRKTSGSQRTTIVIGGSGWDRNPDHTTMLIQDWGVLTTYYRFLKEWLRISRQMVRDQRDLWPTTIAATSTTAKPGDRQTPCPIRHGCGGNSNSSGGRPRHKRRKSSPDSVT